MTWFDQLHERVEREGQRPHVLRAGSGRLLAVEHGARLLACELPGIDHNLFFDTACLGEQQPVTGGDRLWIAPEVAYFWPSLDDARRDPKGAAVTPPQIDPADYRPRGVASESEFALETQMKLADQRNGKTFGVSVTRGWRGGISSALESEAHAGLRGCGFVTTHGLSLSGGGTEGPADNPGASGVAGAWSILQVPPGGTLICPTTARVDPHSYYDPFGHQHVAVDDRCVRFLIDGQRRIKMGIRPEHTTGRMGYYRPPGSTPNNISGSNGGAGLSSLVVRIFGVFPGEPYCDLLRGDSAHDAFARGVLLESALRGDALQAYNDDGDAFAGTTFGEMEYHDPCVVEGCGPGLRTGASVTHVVVGPDEAVRAYGAELLGVEVEGIV